MVLCTGPPPDLRRRSLEEPRTAAEIGKHCFYDLFTVSRLSGIQTSSLLIKHDMLYWTTNRSISRVHTMLCLQYGFFVVFASMAICSHLILAKCLVHAVTE